MASTHFACPPQCELGCDSGNGKVDVAVVASECVRSFFAYLPTATYGSCWFELLVQRRRGVNSLLGRRRKRGRASIDDEERSTERIVGVSKEGKTKGKMLEEGEKEKGHMPKRL
jgi:hypothetical protein